MNNLSFNLLKALRSCYAKFLNVKTLEKPDCIKNLDEVSDLLYNALRSDKPCMIARFGANELNCLINYVAIKEGNKSIIKYIKGDTFQWWWNPGIVNNLHIVAGFFPPSEPYLSRFSELMLQDMLELDILGSWLPDERYFSKELKRVRSVELSLLEPYFSKRPWTLALEGKKVLVVHPFANTIMKQYKKRDLLFQNTILPAFELKTIKAVLSLAEEKTEFANWFEALDYMKSEIDKEDYDICLIGCGAYGFPLAAHVKRNGKKAFHIGGSLQLLFGIKGKRWENEKRLGNEFWVSPGEDETPKAANTVEGGCYW